MIKKIHAMGGLHMLIFYTFVVMKYLFLSLFICPGYQLFGQTVNSINVGAFNNNSLIYSIGEIYVLPTDPDQAGSGFLGALSMIEFLGVGVEELTTTEYVKVYPNPTSSSICLEISSNNPVNHIIILDLNGKLVLEYKISSKIIDLSFLSPGIYFINFDTDLSPIKIIKQ